MKGKFSAGDVILCVDGPLKGKEFVVGSLKNDCYVLISTNNGIIAEYTKDSTERCCKLVGLDPIDVSSDEFCSVISGEE